MTGAAFASWLFASGHAVDLVLGFMVLEVAWLMRTRPAITVLLALAPGAAMLLGVRSALTGLSWIWVALPLTVSLPLHLADMRHRKLI